LPKKFSKTGYCTLFYAVMMIKAKSLTFHFLVILQVEGSFILKINRRLPGKNRKPKYPTTIIQIYKSGTKTVLPV